MYVDIDKGEENVGREREYSLKHSNDDTPNTELGYVFLPDRLARRVDALLFLKLYVYIHINICVCVWRICM